MGPVTAGLLTPESLAELMGGPDIAPVQSNLQTPPGPPNAYNETQSAATIACGPAGPIPPPPPGPEVIPGAGRADAGAAPGRHQGRTAGPPCPLRRSRQEAASEAMVGLVRHRARQGLAVLVVAFVLTSCANWHGIANVPMPGGPGTGPGSYTVYVQMPDTLALNDNSRVRVADVFVGTVRAIKLKNWVATLTLSLDKSVKLPKNATAKIGQTSLLGSQHVELAAPPNPSPELLKDGDTIPLKNSSAYPTTEQTLASLATDVARRRHPEPRSDAERGLQHA